MECSKCRKGTKKPGQVQVYLEKEDAVFVVQGVPADICDECGFYDVLPEVMEILERKAAAILQREAHLRLMHTRPGSA